MLNPRLFTCTALPAAFLLLGLPACTADTTGPGGPKGPSGDFAILTDAHSYEAIHQTGEGNFRIYGFRVIATYRNLRGRTVYLGRCTPDFPEPIYAVRLSPPDPSDHSAFSPGWACVGHDEQFRLRHGESRTDTLFLRGPNSWNGRTKEPRGMFEARVRLVYDVRYCPEDCREEATEAERLSNPFEITLRR